ncbi:MAG: prepilin-type N-terminal cleavage/methylation domain-containing protein [Sedimentisphaerales bacterium]|nr:prepilin-type N-terminal cleavage/methylation domain-containing protein [Sedimentisphaerales bacterium]
MRPRRTTERRGFTLIEALVATVVLTAGVVTLQGLVSRCLVRIRLNEQYAHAWQILDRQLTAIDIVGIDAFVQDPVGEGELEENGITYHWQVQTEAESIDAIYRVTITIQWLDRNRPHRISAVTRLDGLLGVATTTTPTES